MFMKKLYTSAIFALSAQLLCAQPQFEFEKTPELAGKSIIFTVHDAYPNSHHNTETMFQKGEVNEGRWKLFGKNSALVRADFDAEGNAKDVKILESAPDGIIRDVSLSFDAKTALFSMRKNFDDSFKIYEIDLSSGKTKRLTNLADVSDIDPIYMPSGEIVFGSTRAAKYCGCNRHIMCNLYRMNADGTNITQIGNSIEFENTPVVMHDGRILYTRWEYVDRNFSGAQGLWTANPDGTRHALYWGQETKNPTLDAVELEPAKVAAIMGSCHDKGWGALVVIDRNIDVEGQHSVVKIYPDYARAFIDKQGDKWADSMKKIELKFQYPSVLSKNLLLVSRQMKPKDAQLGLYIVDIEKDSVRFVGRPTDPKLGICDAQVIAARPRPPVIPEQRGYASKTGRVYVSNVYEGTHMQGVKQGDIKFLRVIYNPPKINYSLGDWNAEGTQAPAMNYDDYDNKIILGDVPVEADGSAYFEVPADKFFYLQALDKDKKMLQTLRSGLVALPDEIISCTGCHESRKSPPPASGSRASLALKRGVSKYSKSEYCDKLFSYAEFVQPILDRHCVKCHDFGGEGANKIILAGDRGLVFNTSYMQLHGKKAVTAIGAGPDKVQPANLWGAKQSKIIKLINSGHNGVKLSPAEYDTLCAWIDLNAPYYPSDDTNYPNNPGGRSPLKPGEVKRLAELGGCTITSKHWPLMITVREYPFELVSFDRPELSPILAKLDKNSKEYAEALGLIKEGAKRLKASPRPDMAGFKPSQQGTAHDIRREKLFMLESCARKAIENSERFKDPDKL